MSKPTGSVRPLQFPLNRTVDIESETPDEEIKYIDLSQWSSSDPDERVNIVLNLSLNEYVALASCIDVGRDLAYGDNSIYMWWVWVRSLYSMNLCDDIINCINDPNSGVSEAIYNVIQNGEYGNAYDSAQSSGNTNLAGNNNDSCNLDVWWGGINNMVDLADKNNVNALEIFEVVTNPSEWVIEVLGGIFGVEVPLAQSIAEWAIWIQDNIKENYEAQITENYMNGVKCDLHCLAKLYCELTPSMVTNYFYERLGSQLSFSSTLTETLVFLVGGVWTGTEIADAMMLSQFAVRSQWGTWNGQQGWATISLDLKLGFNDPSDDWTLLCTDCGWLWQSDYDVSQNIWYIYSDGYGTYGTWSLGNGYESVDNQTSTTGYSRIISIRTTEFTPTTIDSVSVNFDIVVGSFSLPAQATVVVRIVQNDNTVTFYEKLHGDTSDGDGQIFNASVGLSNVKQITMYLRSCAVNDPNDFDGSIKLNSVTVQGSETNPFI